MKVCFGTLKTLLFRWFKYSRKPPFRSSAEASYSARPSCFTASSTNSRSSFGAAEAYIQRNPVLLDELQENQCQHGSQYLAFSLRFNAAENSYRAAHLSVECI